MSQNDESDILEEIESKVAIGATLENRKAMQKVIIRDKKLKMISPEENDDEDGSETSVSDEEVKPKLKVVIKKKSILVKHVDESLFEKRAKQEAGVGDCVPDDEDVIIEKPKAKRTQKQIDAFEKVRQKKMDNAKLREKEKQKVALAEQKILEEKIIKKALSIKKKQIKKQVILDDISDDDTPIEVIKQMKAKQTDRSTTDVKEVKPIKEKPKYNFI